MTLREWALAHDLTHAELAARLGVSIETARAWLYGKRFPRPAHLVRIETVTEGEVAAQDFYERETA